MYEVKKISVGFWPGSVVFIGGGVGLVVAEAPTLYASYTKVTYVSAKGVETEVFMATNISRSYQSKAILTRFE